jgi:23S rRNA (cytosine1962-C5)-methyltransferase
MLLSCWQDYEILDAGLGMKLERWKDYILLRPEPQAIWPRQNESLQPHAHYIRKGGGGEWRFLTPIPEKWEIAYKDLRFIVKPTGFKHTGIFPEQAVNWEYITSRLKNALGARVLNLFGYTGGATLAAASSGAQVTHVDSSKGIVSWAKDNLALNNLSGAPVRYIVDDAFKFVQREIRRGKRYDAIIMDPPSYGRGTNGEMWKIEQGLFPLMESCLKLMSPNPLFFLISSYTAGLAPQILENIFKLSLVKEFGGTASAEMIGLPIKAGNLVLPCGMSGRWER